MIQKQQLDTQKEPIAIIGSGCRFPGNVTSPHKLWELLCNPIDLTKEVPESRFNAQGFYHPDGEHHGASNVTKAYFLENDPRLFDSVFFNIAPREAEAIDPQQRLLLETVYEAMESAGLTLSSMRGSSTGCYVGVMTGDYAEVVTRDPETFSQYMATGTSRALISNRVSYVFDWSGPSMTVDTACSSSLVAVHLAVQSLRSGETTVACAAGSNLILNADSFIGETSLHMISPDGKSKMWDASANGYARGEGVAAVFLKTLSQALKDGDRIDAIIRETGVNQDGRTQGITLPSPEAQAALIRSTYRRAGLDIDNPADRCQYFEAHGTGTQAGDPREASAISQAFFPNSNSSDVEKLYVGSIKTVIGHTEGCAGVAGLLKAALALKHKTIPPNQHFHNINPSVSKSYKNLCVPISATPWPSIKDGGVLRASVNSFGFGGTNSHAILESYVPEVHDVGRWGRQTQLQAPKTLPTDYTPLPVFFSANSSTALTSIVEKHVDYLEKGNIALHRVAATLLAHRSSLPFKVSFTGPTRDVLLQQMKDALSKAKDTGSDLGKRYVAPVSPGSIRILGVFTGQGAQWPTMGRSLLQHSSHFRQTIALLDDALKTLPDGPQWKLADELAAAPSKSRVREAAISQPACTALQVALVDLLRAAGISFHTVVGHSSGEISAAYAAGFISAVDAVRIAYYRGVHAKLAAGKTGQKGSMIAVGWGIEEAASFCSLEPQLQGRLAVAASNSPDSVTLSGDQDAVSLAKTILDEKGIFNRVLQVDTAYHSHHMIPCSVPYVDSLTACKIEVKKPSTGCVWISSVYGGKEMNWDNDRVDLAGSYWRDNMVQTVLFSQAIQGSLERNTEGFTMALEVGPHPALKGPALQTIKATLGDNMLYEGVLDRKRDDVAAFATALSSLWLNLGPSVVKLEKYSNAFDESTSLDSVNPVGDMPNYPWDHRLLWRESRINKQLRSRRERPHEILGARTTDDSDHEPRWRNILKLEELPWLRNHRIQGQAIVPGALYCVMALEAAAALARLRGENVHMLELRNMDIVKAIALDEASEGTETMFSLQTLDSSTDGVVTASFSLSAAALEDGIMRRVCIGQVRIHSDTCSSLCIPSRQDEQADDLLPMNIDRFYTALGDLGLEYTGPFRALSSLERSINRAAAVIDVEEPYRNIPVHPSWLDVSFQTVFAAFAASNDGSLWSAFLPTKIGSIRLFNPSVGIDQSTDVAIDTFISHFESAGQGSMPKITSSIEIFDGVTGQQRISIEDLTMSALTPTTAKDDRPVFQRTIWAKDILSEGYRSDESSEVNEDILRVSEQQAYRYLEALRSAKSVSSISEQYPALAKLITRLRPQLDVGNNLNHNNYESVDLQLIDRLGQQILQSGLSGTRRLRRQVQTDEPLDSLFDRWHNSRYGINHTQRQLSDLTNQIAHQYPRMRILQLGASSSGISQQLVTELGSQFTSFTVAFETVAQLEKSEANKTIHDDRLKRISLETEEALSPNSFELVILADPLRSASQIQTARGLMRPGGFLLMVTPEDDCFYMDFLRTASEAKAQETTPSLSQLHKALQESGFSGILSSIGRLDDQPNYATSVVVSQSNDELTAVLRNPFAHSSLGAKLFNGDLIIIGGTTLRTIKFAESIQSRLSVAWKGSIHVIESLLDVDADITGNTQAIISLTELDRPAFKHLDQESFTKLQDLLLSSKTISWVTSKSSSSSPYHSALVGLGRTVIAEDPEILLQFLDVDTVEGSETAVSEAILRLVASRQLKPHESSSPLWSTELELAIEGGNLYIPRIVMDQERNNSVNSIRRVITSQVSTSRAIVSISRAINGSYIAHKTRELAASNLSASTTVRVNYCLNEPISGHYTQSSQYLCLGTLDDNSQVLAVIPGISSHVRVPRENFVILDELSLKTKEDTAQYLTQVYYNLQAKLILSLLPKTETVLLFQLDESIRALLETYLQSESNRQIWFLNFLAPTDDISPSGRRGRTITIRSGASRRELLNLLPRDLSLVAHFDEQSTKESFTTLQNGLRYKTPIVSLSKLQAGFPLDDIVQRLLSTLPNDNATFSFSRNVSVIDAKDLVGQSLSSSQRLQVIRWDREQTINIQARKIDASTLFSANKTYLLVGLAGQMGQSICKWMVQNGARHVVVTSRRPPRDGHWISELQSLGAQIRIEAADVTRKEDVVRLFDDISKDMPKLAGVMNGAMLLADGMFADMSFESMQKVLKPKVDGSRILDQVFADVKLDFFIMLSSVNAATGMAGQANYSAANMFMVGLARDRKRRHLAASVVDIGMVIGIGVIQRTEGDAGTGVIEKNLRRQNLAPISEPDLHNMLAEAIVAGTSDDDVEIITGLQHYVSSSPNRPAWYRNPRFSHLVTEAVVSDSDGGDGLNVSKRKVINANSEEEACLLLEDALIEYLATELMMSTDEISADTPIIDLGVDSLVAAALRSWLLAEHTAEVPVLKILGGSSIRQVCQEGVSKMSFTRSDADVNDKNTKGLNEKATSTKPLPTITHTAGPPHSKGEQQRSSLSSSSSSALSTPQGTSKPSSATSSEIWDEFEGKQGDVLKRAPQSLGQSRLYYSSEFLDDTSPFNCTTSYHLFGPIDIERLAKAFDLMIQRHEILRTAFYTDQITGQAMQGVLNGSSFQLKVLDGCSKVGDVEAEFQRIHYYCFDLPSANTLIATLLSHDLMSHTLVFGYHHIIIDGVSWQLFLQDLTKFYNDPINSTSTQSVPASCIDFAEKQRRDIQQGAYKERAQFWQAMFPEPPSSLPLFPFAKVGARRALTKYSMRDTMVPIDAELIEGIKRASVASRITPFHFWLTGFQVLLGRLLQTSDICIGIVDANRSDPTFVQTIGFLLEIMPIRFNVQDKQKFSDLLKDTRSKVYGALGHSGIPIEELARACGVPSDKMQTPFAQVIFNYRMGATKAPNMGDARMEFLDYSDAKVPFDLAISVDEKEDGTGFLTVSAQDYLYDREAVNLLIATYKILLRKFSSDTSCLVGDVPIYDSALVERGIELGTGLPTEAKNEPDTLSKRFNTWVSKDPQAMSIKDTDGRSMTYSDLSHRADQIATALQLTKGFSNKSRVAVLCEPTVDTSAIIISLHRLGAVYVPLDVYATDQRLLDIIDESDALVLIHHGPTAARASKLASGRQVGLFDLKDASTVKVQNPIKDISSADNTAFILYTSGSTGKPKGIPLTHANVCAVITASTQRLSLTREIVLQQTGQGFDAAVWEIFVALANGGTVIVTDNHGDPAELAALMKRERVTVTLLIISEAHALLQYGHRSLRECTDWRVAICAGENFTPNLIDKIVSLGLPGLRVINGYGPTETSIFSALGEVALIDAATRGADYRVPIGTALPGYGMYVVDPELRALPIGWVGEVAICGPGVVRSGYLGRPELTVAKWRSASFLSNYEGAREIALESLCYLTGDRGRMLEDGSLLILGRIDGDSQVKLRGFRVELDEVAACIIEASRGNISDARVVVRGNSSTEHKFLVAFVVLNEERNVSNDSEYLQSLISTLPLAAYMRPSTAVALKTLPFTERGKLDTKALENIELPSFTTNEEIDDEETTECESTLKTIWRGIIQTAGGIPARIQRSSDFFSIGGNSLLLLQLKAEIQQVFGVEISLPELFQSSTLQSLAARIEGSTGDIEVEEIDWEQETEPANIPSSILDKATISPRPLWSKNNLSILLTGASGFLGNAILRQLVANPKVRRVHCVAVRDPSRIPTDLDSSKVVIHRGNLSQPLLGLPDITAAARIFAEVDAVVHNGAEVSHMKSYGSLRSPNVGSTRELARLLLENYNKDLGIPSIHFVSTGGVALLTGWDTLPEARLPSEAQPATDGSSGYISSKWVSERLLEKLVDRVPGIEVFIHRPSNITGDGVGSQDIVHNVLRFSKSLQAVPDLGTNFGTFDLIGVDTTAKGIIDDVLDRQDSVGDRVVYRHQSGETVVPASQLKEYLGHSDTIPFRVLTMDEWIDTAMAAGMDELVASFLRASTGEMRMPLLEKK